MGFFDDPKRSTGVLTSRLSADAAKVNGLVGGQMSIMMQSLGAMGVGLFIAFYYEWRLTLVIFAFMPALTVGSSEFTTEFDQNIRPHFTCNLSDRNANDAR